MPAGRWIGFGLVWLALSLFTFELIATAGGSWRSPWRLRRSEQVRGGR